MPFQTDPFTGCTGLIKCLATWSNTVTDGAFWTIILIGFGIILFMSTIRLGSPRAFGFASFACGSGSMLFGIVGLIPWYIVSIFLLLMGGGLVIMRMAER